MKIYTNIILATTRQKHRKSQTIPTHRHQTRDRKCGRTYGRDLINRLLGSDRGD